jgi:aspartyl-tRNA(Asn)/glutamyl-tRNA(Gln) amidotransferase subunit B
MEIHVQLDTKSKMFTGAANGFGGEPNSQVDEQVLGLPGTLPVMNKRAVEYSIKAGLALGCRIARRTKWDRKSYYYPDLPKNYQISQYDLPLCCEGLFQLALDDGSLKPIRIRRAHLEEDAGKLLHEAPGGHPIDYSIVDLNRAGTPLLEIVTEPDLSGGREVAAFGQELQKIVQFLGVSRGQMQMGHMRFEPNINVHITDEHGQIHKTAITEIKNLNSFSVLERATDYEARRQIAEWEQTGTLGRKSTYGWDESTQSTFHQRDKEEAHDYRYFPDPDLPPVEVDDAWLEELRSQIGELPATRRQRYIAALGLSPADAGILAAERATGDYFDESTSWASWPIAANFRPMPWESPRQSCRKLPSWSIRTRSPPAASCRCWRRWKTRRWMLPHWPRSSGCCRSATPPRSTPPSTPPSPGTPRLSPISKPASKTPSARSSA